MCGEFGALYRRVQREAVEEMGGDFAVAESAHRGQVAIVAHIKEARDFVDQPGVDHPIDARIDAGVQKRARLLKTNSKDAPRRRALHLQGADGCACQHFYFQSADHAADIVGMDALGGDRVRLAQPLMQGGGGAIAGVALQLGAQLRIRRHTRDRPAFFDRADVLPAAADQEGQVAAPMIVLNSAVRAVLILRQAEAAIRRNDVNLVVGNPRALLGGRFGGADVHVPINLTAVSADDFAAMGLRQLDCQAGLADAGRTENDDERGRVTSQRHPPRDQCAAVRRWQSRRR